MFKSKKDINLYLKILSEESIKKAYAELDKFLSEADDDIFGGDENKKPEEDKPEEPSGEEQSPPEQDAGEETSTEIEPPKEKENVKPRPIPLTLELGKVTSQGLIATLNMIRGGRSFNDPDISAQLEEYLEQELNDAERLALATFLSALRDIATGEPASQAPSPDDENVSIDATDQEKSQNMDQTQKQQSGAIGSPPKNGFSNVPSPPPEQEEEPQEDLEDTTPPIQVVGRRNEELERLYREKIRKILQS